MTALPTISLVFVNYRSLWALTHALESLGVHERQSVPYEVIIVNNDERETRALDALAKQYPILVIHAPTNEGFGAGINRGVAIARGSIVGILNPDIRFREPLFEKVQALLVTTPRAVCAPTLVLLSGEAERYSFGLAPTLARILCRHLGLGRVYSGQAPDWMSGAALFLAKESYLRLRGFDPKYFLYYEDVDFCLRAKSSGSTLMRLSETIVHLGGQSFSSRRVQKGYYYSAQRRYFDTYRPKIEARFLRWLQWIVAPGL